MAAPGANNGDADLEQFLQLRDESAAEDAVQETLLAAVKGRAGFSGKSSVRTRLIDQLLRAAIKRYVERGSR
jgi:DNA-directed RNA polymerase specialized sigma24 family protein